MSLRQTDSLLEKYGTDVTRAYLMFMGPYEGDVTWSAEAINGVKRFVSKYYTFLLSLWSKKDDKLAESKEVARLVNKIHDDILNFKFNTSVSALMQFCNSNTESVFSSIDVERLILLTAPILPHLAEELWEQTGHEFSVHSQKWPEIDENLLEDDIMEIPVQINGKLKGKVKISSEATQVDVEKIVLESEILGDIKMKKLIYVPKKIVSVVV